MNTKRQKIFHESSATTNPIVTSSFFEQKIWVKFHNLECQMVDQLNRIDFMQCKGVMAVYNPLVYASEVHQNFLRTYLDGEKKVLFLGMNPGIGAINTGVRNIFRNGCLLLLSCILICLGSIWECF